MTTEQKSRIVSLRNAGQGYTAVAREVGMSKSAVRKYCEKIGLNGVRNNLLSEEERGNVGVEERLRAFENKGTVTYEFADEPDETVLPEILRILTSVR